MNIEQFDERQKAIRNKIMTKAFALAIILLCGAIILNECKVIEIGKTVSFTGHRFIHKTQNGTSANRLCSSCWNNYDDSHHH